MDCTTIRVGEASGRSLNRSEVKDQIAPSWIVSFVGLHFAADPFGFAEDAEQVAAQNLADIVGAVAAVEQDLRDSWQVGGGGGAFGRCAADAVKIRAQADVINASDFRDMVDVIHPPRGRSAP